MFLLASHTSFYLSTVIYGYLSDIFRISLKDIGILIQISTDIYGYRWISL